MRRRHVLIASLLLLACFRVPAQQPLSEEEKKRLFLKAREEMTTIPYTPSKPEAAPKPKPKSTPATTIKPPAPTPTPSKPEVVKPEPPKPEAPKPTPAPQPVAPAKPQIPYRPPEPPPRAPIVVRDSGVSKVDDDEKAPPKEESVWSRLFGGGGGSYKYLTPAVRRAIDRATVTKGRWRNIVVHNSGTRQGNAAAFEHYHRYVRKMPNGMAYHFVIGNGTSSKNGGIEIGSRWHRQMQGGHVHSDYLNNISLGICLVGDFNRDVPTAAQREALEELIRYLRRRVGRVGGQPAVVWAHRNINPPRWPTDCPGNKFPFSWLDRKF